MIRAKNHSFHRKFPIRMDKRIQSKIMRGTPPTILVPMRYNTHRNVTKLRGGVKVKTEANSNGDKSVEPGPLERGIRVLTETQGISTRMLHIQSESFPIYQHRVTLRGRQKKEPTDKELRERTC